MEKKKNVFKQKPRPIQLGRGCLPCASFPPSAAPDDHYNSRQPRHETTRFSDDAPNKITKNEITSKRFEVDRK